MLRTVFAGAIVATAAAFAPAGPVRLRCRKHLEPGLILAACGRHAASPRSTASSPAALSYSLAAASVATPAHRQPRHPPNARTPDVRGLRTRHGCARARSATCRARGAAGTKRTRHGCGQARGAQRRRTGPAGANAAAVATIAPARTLRSMWALDNPKEFWVRRNPRRQSLRRPPGIGGVARKARCVTRMTCGQHGVSSRWACACPRT